MLAVEENVEAVVVVVGTWLCVLQSFVLFLFVCSTGNAVNITILTVGHLPADFYWA